jgi:hypothetical protein
MANPEFVIRNSGFRHSGLLRFHQRPAGVMAAVGTNDVRRLGRAALRAGLQLLWLQGVVRAAHAGAGVGLFAFWDGHGGNLSEMLASKGFGEFISLCGRANERQGRDKTARGARKLSGAWQFVAGLKII